VALNRWEKLLKDTYGTRKEKASDIKKATDLVVGELNAMSA